ncbi:MAG: hypothetical protein IKU58_09770 [Clostridia bacterium]|nr:hypothetical protein [Clostridia bacterium]
MNHKLQRFANLLQWTGSLLLLLSALRADGGLGFWLAPAITGTLLTAAGLGLWWLCSDDGRAFRRRSLGAPVPAPAVARREPIPFPKAG